MPAGFPFGMFGIGVVIDGAMQHAPHFWQGTGAPVSAQVACISVRGSDRIVASCPAISTLLRLPSAKPSALPLPPAGPAVLNPPNSPGTGN
jgi:hypothetical protein